MILHELRRILQIFGFCVFASGLLFLMELMQVRRGVVWTAAGGLILLISEFLPEKPPPGQNSSAPKRNSSSRDSAL